MPDPWLTIFTTCRPHEGEFADVQYNAVGSWTQLRPEPEVVLIGDEPGTEGLAREMRLTHIPNVVRNRWGIPLLSSLFWTALTCGAADVYCYVNADVILMPDFVPALEACIRRFDVFLMAGPRWDVTILGRLEFGGDWRRSVDQCRKQNGVRHKPTGLDYFAFTRKTFLPSAFPPLAIGQTSWDSWLVWKALHKKIPVIDASMAVTAVHQVHPVDDGRDEQQRMNHSIADQDRIGRGYIWEAPYRIDSGRKYVVNEVKSAMLRWCEDVGWEL